MTIRKWFFLFWTTMAIGAGATLVTGLAMQLMDQTLRAYGWSGAGFNTFNMVLVGLLIGAFSQMGFFAYLTVNYIALSVFRKSYLWSALQAYTTVFALGFLVYVLYQSREQTGMVLFWALPIVLAAVAWGVGYWKTRLTNNKAFIPTLFLMIVVTSIEAWPSFQGEGGEVSASAIWFMMIPLAACNAYQILTLQRITSSPDKKEAASARGAKTA
ncbi:KinB-signaling pathway activation protein [Paenibacillus pasadenensis]|uniref:KinB signaling pathway activation protein n=1 Tax=Paenibacillus pasadenensis TaxID=217090 RepID=A0A2N5N1J2_9BACL|nr:MULTISPECIES: KinB-signaling pathway activation protein [Paenibacillus]PLT44186.1 KinB signaling pathway activation protein [Paenibacillus pasadenensis]QGG54716.1 KinB signaling pathway activation protein [Paenibacillus sp. B01]